MPELLDYKKNDSPDELFNELIDLVKRYDTDKKQLAVLEKAYRKASEAHKTQFRASGEPYIIHPLQAAKILARVKMDIPTIAAAILHDVIEDTPLSYDDIKNDFGKTVADLVEGVTKLTAISETKEIGNARPSSSSRLDKQAENLRKIFLAMSKDIRVILIKIADRLHNLQTLDALPERKRKAISRETLEIFAPITGRLGMWEFKWQLEDLAFSHLRPEKFKKLVQMVDQRRKEREIMVKEVMEKIQKSLEEVGLKDIDIEGRPKHLYSIYQKMENKNRSLNEIYDLTAIRVIVNTVRECYQVLGVVHNLWMPFQDRFKDYIAMPKSNNYRSLHTTVYGPGNQPVEVQIRTREMHRVNEFGIAAHWAYKEGASKVDVDMFSEIYPWIRRILDWEDESKDAREYIENLKLDLIESEVFVFTPKGDVIDLPAGSTPIDFAYRIHTEVGHRCIGAKVNSKIVPIEYKLKNADIVEILTSKHGTPSLDWLKIARSTHARNKIRQWFKKERKEENIARGKDAVSAELKRNRIEISLSNADVFGKIAERYNFKTIDDLFASVGYGETGPMTILNRVRDLIGKKKKQKVTKPSDEELKRRRKKRRKSKSPVRIKGVENLMVRFARCCSPVWGDDVIGYITMGKGVSIHRLDCPNYQHLSQNPERIVEVEWIETAEEKAFTVEIEVDAWDRSGILSEVMNVMNEMNFYLRSAKAWAKGPKAIIKVLLDVSSKQELDKLTNKLKKIKSVIRVFRVSRRSL